MSGMAAPTFEQDFIILSEFSEQEGPIPLLVVPQGAEGRFNLNSFVLRIMAVDYQQKTEAGLAPEDTQVMICEQSEGAFAYVHHFTLHDVFARGYVRPVCLSYVTSDATKIMRNFDSFLSEFNEVAGLFKTGNKETFISDLDSRRLELLRAKEFISDYEQNHKGLDLQRDDKFFQNPMTPDVIEAIIHDLDSMKTRVDLSSKGYSVQEIRDHLMNLNEVEESEVDDGEGEGDEEGDEDEDEDGIGYTSIREGLEQFKDNGSGGSGNATSAALKIPTSKMGTQAGGVGGVSGREGDMVPASWKDNAEYQMLASTPQSKSASTWSAAKSMPKFTTNLTGFLSNTFAQELTDTLSTENYDEMVELFGKLQKQGNNFEKVLRTMEELCGHRYKFAVNRLVELQHHFRKPTLALYLETEDCALLSPTASVLTIGNTVVANYRVGTESLFEVEEVSSSKALGFRRFVGEGTEPVDMVRIPLPKEEKEEENGNGESVGSSSSSSSLSSSSSVSNSKKSTSKLTSSFSRKRKEKKEEKKVQVRDELDKTDGRYETGFGDMSDIETTNFTPPKGYEYLPEFDMEKSMESPIDFFSNQLWDPEHTNGLGILDLRSRLLFMKHLIYALLKGRTVVVVGQAGSESKVRAVVDALCIFVPGLVNQEGITRWRTTPLSLMDLCRCKLVGLSKKAGISNSLEKYVSIYDVDHDVLKTPPYTDGVLVEKLVASKQSWPDEDTYVAHLHACYVDLGTKACL
eukprot:TRINITY_DN1076_c0_g1_i2.p1 TRINITY_DN1076_c0_g1~~TRINITY_DN1076_c0_g1_i2.p1  ORF type:complete len:744 (+),score=241.92 TRINITY_DN1076_c0_g1_i2:853-3084(+)